MAVKQIKKVKVVKAKAKPKTTKTNTIRQVNLVDAYYTEMANILINGTTSMKMPVSKLIEKNFNSLMKKADAIQTSERALVMMDKLVKETQDYLNSKNKTDVDYTEYLINRKCTPWQKEYFTDQAKRIANQSGRRSGKTYGNALKAVKHCLEGFDVIGGVQKPRKAVIVGLTKEKTQEQYWNLIKDTITECHINTEKIDNSSLIITFSSGATLRLSGNNSKAEREKLRGDEYSLIIIDEAQSQQGLRYMMDSIFEPIAYARDSQIILSGTGALILGSYWQEITDGEKAAKWRHYHVTMRDNPTVADPDNVLQKVLEDKGWTDDDPEYVREYLGQNSYDSTRTVIPNRKYFDKLPNAIWEKCIIGLDYGFEDCNAFVPVLVDNTGRRYVTNVFKGNHMSASDIVRKAKEITAWAQSLKIPKILFIADTNDQSISQDIYREGIKIVNAYKVDERLQWSKLKEHLSNGTIQIEKDKEIDWECARTVWKYDEDAKKVVYEIDDDIFHPDALDALRYADYFLTTKQTSKREYH